MSLLLMMCVLFVETGLLLGVVLAGDSLLFSFGVLLASGAVHVPFLLAAAGVALAAYLGSQLDYRFGRAAGPRLFNRLDSRLFSQRHAALAGAFFERPGAKAVLLARFVAVIRTLTPMLAGVVGMSRRRFLVDNAVGAVL